MVVENVDPRHLDRALWLFPAYLIAINLFVVPIALAGLLSVPAGTDPDTLVVALPLGSGHGGLALLAFLGGLSAAASMVIVETVALSTMICNDLAVPLLLRLGWLGPDTRPVLLGIRRAAIALVVLLGFAYVRIVRESYGLVSIGLVSFAAVAQFFPAIVLGLFWRGAGREEGRFWRGTAQVSDLVQLVSRFLGEAPTREAFAAEARGRGRDPSALAADAETVRLAERLLAGAIGSASARVMVASVVHEEPIGTEEVMRILDETSQAIEYSRRLEQQSRKLEATTAELRRANERLRELDRLKDDFVSTVSHELRTPLTSIRSFSEILLDNPALEQHQRQEFLRIIVNESERLTRLINDMLDLAKIEAGKLEWHMQRVSASEVAREAATALGQLFRDKSVELKIELPDSVPTIIA